MNKEVRARPEPTAVFPQRNLSIHFFFNTTNLSMPSAVTTSWGASHTSMSTSAGRCCLAPDGWQICNRAYCSDLFSASISSQYLPYEEWNATNTQSVEIPLPTPFTTVQGVPVATKNAYSCITPSNGTPRCWDQDLTEFLVEDRTLAPGEETVVGSVTLSAGPGFLLVASKTLGGAGAVSTTTEAQTGLSSTTGAAATGTSAETTVVSDDGEENGAQGMKMMMASVAVGAALAIVAFL